MPVPEQKVVVSAGPLSHTDLRIIPEGYEIPETTSPLEHRDLRIVEAPAETEN